MMNRIKNAGESSEKYETIFNDILQKQDVEEEIKNAAKEFLSK